MNAYEILKKAAAPKTLLMGISSVISGTAAAASHGNIEILVAILCLMFVIFGQIAANYTHRYCDDKYHFGENRVEGFYDEKMTQPVSWLIKEGIKAFSILAAMAGFAILAICGWWTLCIAALLGIIIVTVNLGRHPFTRRPVYLLASFLIFGPIGVIGTELTQSWLSTDVLLNKWDIAPAIVMSIIMGCMAVNVHLIFGMVSRKKDIQIGKRTFAVKYGPNISTGFIFFNGLVYASAGIIGPFLIDMPNPIAYLPLPIVSFGINSWLAYKAFHHPDTPQLTRIALWNMFLYSIIALIILWSTGYAPGTHDIILE